MKRLFLVFFFVLALLLLTQLRLTAKQVYFAAGSGNPGKINLYEVKGNNFQKIKELDTGFRFVHTVRLGDIYNNGSPKVIAGVSNSFFAEPYGCQLVSYDLKTFQKEVIDNVGDLRCKDLTIGDADNDGKNEILLGTHGEGWLRLYKWQNNAWQKEDLEHNFVAKIDQEEKTNHRVPNKELTCQECVVQTAVHIVKVADVDNDGKNEVISTMSSPLELQNVGEISFVRVFKKVNGVWQSEIVDRTADREYRSITVGDFYHTGKKVLLIGIGSPRGEKGSLYTFEKQGDGWEKKLVYNDEEEQNMKGVSLGDYNRDGQADFLLATGFPNAKIILFDWNQKDFTQTKVGEIAQVLKIPDAQYNSMVSFLLPHSNQSPSLVIGGSTVYPKQKLGWEGTKDGYLVVYRNVNNQWQNQVVETRNILGMDMYETVKQQTLLEMSPLR